MSFELTFLGASGGPLEGSTCSILLKSKDVSYNDIVSGGLADELVCIDAGSGMGQLSEIIYNEINGIPPHSKLLQIYNDTMSLLSYVKTEITHPYAGLARSRSAYEHTHRIFEMVKSYLISHPHMDHVAGLIINSAGFDSANTKRVYGSNSTINALQKHIFNGLIWPNMHRYNILKLIPHNYWQKYAINDIYSVSMFDISHGKLSIISDEQLIEITKSKEGLSNTENVTHYESSAFLITHEFKRASILIFGDFESDCVSNMGKNRQVWQAVAPMLVDPSAPLKAIILECSSMEKSNELYGHLMPQHLIKEFIALNNECLALLPAQNQNASLLKGFNVVINHIKESPDGSSDPRRKILEELELLNDKYGLGIHFSIALTGISISL